MAPATTFAKGKLPVNPENFARALKLSKYHDLAAVEYPDIDYSGDYAHWKDTLDGNGTEGDCVPCGIGNTRRLEAAVLLGDENLSITIDQIVALYQIFNPGFDPNGSPSTNGPGSQDDGGCNIQDVLEWLVKNGFPIGPNGEKLAGFVKVDHTNLEALRGAISLGGSVLVGGIVTDTQQQEFPNKPWTWDPSGANGGGHCFLLTGFVRAKKLFTGVCWAAAFPITEDYLNNGLDEAWLLIWPSMLQSREFTAGTDVATFAADVAAATGQPFPVAVPAPAPSPSPGPSPAPSPAPQPDPTPAPTTVGIPKIAEPAQGATLANGDITIEGEADNATQVTVMDDTVELGSVTSDASLGTWSLPVILSPGSHNLWAYETVDGDVGSASTHIMVGVIAPDPEPTPEPTDPDEIFAAWLKKHVVGHRHIMEYQIRLELRMQTEAWLAARPDL